MKEADRRRGEASLVVGSSDLTFMAWLRIPERARASVGDVAAAFDPAERRGLTLGLLDSSPCGT